MTLIELIHYVTGVLFLLSTVLILLSFIKGKKLENKVIVLDLFSTLLIILCFFFAIMNKKSYFIDAAIVLSIVSFLGTIAFARFLNPLKRGEP